MKKILATAIASLALMGVAFAATVEGKVQSVDPATRTITLEDGTSVIACDKVPVEVLASLSAGSKVKVTTEDGSSTATSVELVE
jgi:hypothetical protein